MPGVRVDLSSAKKVASSAVATGSKVAEHAAATRRTAAAAASAAARTVAAVVEPPPPPRPSWTYGLIESCGMEPGYGAYACFVPCLATAEVVAYRKTGDPNAKADAGAAILGCLCFYFCGDGCLAQERSRDRDMTNMTDDDCNAACWDTCLSTSFCWGCATVQQRLELKVYYGHAAEGAPVHPGSPAARAMARD